MAVEELKRLPGSKVEEVAALIHQLAQDVDEQKRQAFAATFASMSAEEADAFQRVIDEACERIDLSSPSTPISSAPFLRGSRTLVRGCARHSKFTFQLSY